MSIRETPRTGVDRDFRMYRLHVPLPLAAWTKEQGLPPYEWRKPGIADYCAESDTWQVGEVTLQCVAEAEEERYYCGLYEGPMEQQPVMYYVIMPLAMLPAHPQKRTDLSTESFAARPYVAN